MRRRTSKGQSLSRKSRKYNRTIRPRRKKRGRMMGGAAPEGRFVMEKKGESRGGKYLAPLALGGDWEKRYFELPDHAGHDYELTYYKNDTSDTSDAQSRMFFNCSDQEYICRDSIKLTLHTPRAGGLRYVYLRSHSEHIDDFKRFRNWIANMSGASLENLPDCDHVASGREAGDRGTERPWGWKKDEKRRAMIRETMGD